MTTISTRMLAKWFHGEYQMPDPIIADPHVEPGAKAKTVDLSQVDFAVLEKKFAKSKTKNIEAQQLRALIERKLDNMIRMNASRYDFLDRFQKMIEEYNNGAMSIEQLFEELVNISKDLNEEEQRHVRENVSEEQLAIFGILTRPGPDLDPKEIESIKKVCKELAGSFPDFPTNDEIEALDQPQEEKMRKLWNRKS
ncbi:type I restriction enzyme endonuclease domain-containing protein [Haloferula chungangensis]|uniref:Type I restriction enzyme endonuclease domain-containing protein n=1 Tax=Haloferula chungangensis TaxID=1048331 RepID=A0ABW2L006_9BACT